MAFRDDRDALRAKNESLEDEVGELQQKLEDAEQALSKHEAKDHEDEDELAKLRAEVGQLKKRLGVADGEEAEPDVNPIVIGAVILALVIGVGGYVMLGSSDEPTLVPVPVPAIPEIQEVVLQEDALKHGLDVAYFGAVVVEADGIDAAVGDGCVLEVDLDRPTGRARFYCRELLADVDLDGATLWASPGVTSVGEMAARFVSETLTFDTLRHEIELWDGGGTRLARLYVQDFSLPIVGAAVPPTPEPPTDIEPVDRDLAALYQALVDDASCDLDGRFGGRIRTARDDLAGLYFASIDETFSMVVVDVDGESQDGSGDSVLLTPFDDVAQPTREVDCEAGTASLISEELTLNGRFGPAFATFIGSYERMGEEGVFWMRRLGAGEGAAAVWSDFDVDVDVEQNLDSLPPEVGEAVQQAVERALEEAR